MDIFRIVEKLQNHEPVTEAELDRLDQWLCSAEGRSRFKEETERRLNDCRDDWEVDLSHLLERIRARRIQTPSRTRALRPLAKWMAAAVIVVLVGMGLWMQSERNKEKNVYLTYDGQFGSSNRAILTLANGRTIAVDEYTGEHVKEEGTVVRLQKGALQYENTEEAREEVFSPAFHTIFIPRGGEYQLTLSDGTVVWLNSDSRLRYPVSFSLSERRLILVEGEAFFDVAPDVERPFIVECSGQDVMVLGTQFNLSAYTEQAHIQTTLVSGSVRIHPEGSDTLVLHPGQQAQLDKSSGTLSVREVDVSVITAWKDGFLVIEDQTLDQIMNTISRWYSLEYEIDADVPNDRIFRGIIPKYDIDGTIQKLEMISKLKLQLDGRRIKVTN